MNVLSEGFAASISHGGLDRTISSPQEAGDNQRETVRYGGGEVAKHGGESEREKAVTWRPPCNRRLLVRTYWPYNSGQA
eukprot:scaffold957_cov402-Prasinococcus_capsulatus_cf.AAC.23